MCCDACVVVMVVSSNWEEFVPPVLTCSHVAHLGVLCAFVSHVNLSLRMQERRTDSVVLYGSVVLFMVSKNRMMNGRVLTQARPAAILVCVVNTANIVTPSCTSDGETQGRQSVLLKLMCNAVFCSPFYRLYPSIYIIYVSD